MQNSNKDGSNSLDFSTVMASSVHDMKNSLSMLLCTLDEINSVCGNASCESANKFAQLQYEGQRLNNHLIQLLAIYRLDQDDYSVNIRENDLEEFLEESVLEYDTLLTPKGITITADCEDGLSGYFDRELVAGVVNNIVNNAYKYSKDKIRLSGQREDGYVVITVEDNGPGYPAMMLCDTATQTANISFQTGNTGLGLYFSALVARSHRDKEKQGFIRCSNEGIDGGGKFSIYLP